eukprot:Plantae.Rhodophyta-Purpureofilum_apyrenoidigerum.ctg7921.p1 GENE.Plantae.Rhodophyta-Purpureofilum_apyrenoidigerum.ctg7921~~Plantae.Rhodophyta-Purpureofilum_apyrenoidigerum.ctg7921.p1  ORF type:complete len:427 (-),score=86.76 Plantae.Rhodophyta-Purpureofilum_apyrenoidigerum.ctg7921:114-1394(-)
MECAFVRVSSAGLGVQRTPAVQRRTTRWRASTQTEESKKQQLREQMQFWLSIPNLKRDWYLRGKMNRDGWVSAETFMRFNILKDLDCSVDEIMDAVNECEGLEVNRSLKTVRAKFDLDDFKQSEEDERERTVFLLGLNRSMSHKDVALLVEDVAKPLYIKIGRHRDRQPKGWALIEFEDEAAAQKCVQKFEQSEDKYQAMTRDEFEVHTGSKDSRSTHAKPTLLFVTGIPENTRWGTVYDTLKAAGANYVNFNSRNATEVIVQTRDVFQMLRNFENGVFIDETKLTAEVVSTEDEQKYWGVVNGDANTVEWTTGSSVERFLNSWLTVKSTKKESRVLEVTEISSSLTRKDIWAWINAEDVGVRYLNYIPEQRKAVIFFDSKDSMMQFGDALSSGNLFAGHKVKARPWSDDEADEYWRKQSKARASP